MDVAIGRFGSRSFFQMNGESIEMGEALRFTDEDYLTIIHAGKI